MRSCGFFCLKKISERKKNHFKFFTQKWVRDTHISEGRNVELNEVPQVLADKAARLDVVKQGLTDKSYELTEVHQALTNKKNEVREQAYFDKMLDLKYENECLKRENQDLKAENRTLKEKLNKAYEFIKQFTINGINMLEHFLRSIGEWVQQKVAGMSR